MELKTDRLILRPITLEDGIPIFNYRSDSVTNKYQTWIPKNLSDVYDFIDKTAANINMPDSWYQLVIINRKSNEIIGDIGIHFIGMENRQVELGCTLAKEHQGKGFARESLQWIIDYLFTKLNKHRITASIDPNNIQSVKLMESLRFRKEAHFIKSLFIEGSWEDDMIYAILQEEWKLNNLKDANKI